MKHCPAPDCDYRHKHGAPAEFVDSVEVCSDCGAPLAEGPAPAAVSTAQVPGLGGGRAPLPKAARQALVVTVVGALLAIVATWIPLPQLDLEILQHQLGTDELGGLFNMVPTQLSWAALGLGGFVSSFWLVELVAIVLPPLRRLRLRPEGREKLTLAALSLGLLFVAFSAWETLTWLRSLGGAYGSVLTDYEHGGRMTGAAMIAGSFGLLMLARAVDGRGLINGFSVVIGSGLLLEAAHVVVQMIYAARSGMSAPVDILLTAGVAGASVALGWFGTGADADAVPRPAVGLVPASWASALLIGLMTLAWTFDLDLDPASLPAPGSWTYILLYGALSFALTAGLTWALYTPGRVQAHLSVFGLEEDAKAFTLRAPLLTAMLFTGALVVLNVVPQETGAWAAPLVFVTLGAIAHDLWEALQRRRAHADLVCAWPMHRLHLVGPVLQLLEEEGIAASARGLHHRALGQIFAPWVPVDIMVPEADLERTRALLDERLPRD